VIDCSTTCFVIRFRRALGLRAVRVAGIHPVHVLPVHRLTCTMVCSNDASSTSGTMMRCRRAGWLHQIDELLERDDGRVLGAVAPATTPAPGPVARRAPRPQDVRPCVDARRHLDDAVTFSLARGRRATLMLGLGRTPGRPGSGACHGQVPRRTTMLAVAGENLMPADAFAADRMPAGQRRRSRAQILRRPGACLRWRRWLMMAAMAAEYPFFLGRVGPQRAVSSGPEPVRRLACRHDVLRATRSSSAPPGPLSMPPVDAGASGLRARAILQRALSRSSPGARSWPCARRGGRQTHPGCVHRDRPCLMTFQVAGEEARRLGGEVVPWTSPRTAAAGSPSGGVSPSARCRDLALNFPFNLSRTRSRPPSPRATRSAEAGEQTPPIPPTYSKSEQDETTSDSRRSVPKICE